MKFTCDQCGTRYSIADEKVERKILKIRCKVCKFVMVVRGSDRHDESVASMAASFDNQPEVEWYVAIAGQQHGPMPIERVRELVQEDQLSAQDLVWNEDMSGWEEAGSVADLAGLFKTAKPVAPPPLPPMPSVAPAIVEPPIEELGDSAILGPDLSLDETNEDPRSAPRFSEEAEHRTQDDMEPVRVADESIAPLDEVQASVGSTETLAYSSPGDSPSPSSELLRDIDAETVMEDGASFINDLSGETDDEIESPAEDDLALADTGAEPMIGHVPTDVPTAPSHTGPEQPASLPLPISEPSLPIVPDEIVAPKPLRVADVPTEKIIPSSAAENLQDDFFQPETVGKPASAPAAVPAPVSTMPVQRKKKTSVGLVVAASIIGAAAMFCAVWFGLNGSQNRAAPSDNKEVVSVTQTTETPVTTQIADAGAKDATPVADAKVVDATSVAPDAAEPKETTRTRKKRSRGAKSKSRKPKKSNLVASKSKGSQKSKPPVRRSSLFSGGPGPSALLPDTSKKEKETSTPSGLTDGLSQAEVVKVIAQYKKGLDGCYQRQLKREPLRDSRLMLKFRIRQSGRTSNVSIGKKYDGTVLKSCLDALVRRWRFPQFRGEPIDIEYPLIFATRF